jgi:predicted RNA methylase
MIYKLIDLFAGAGGLTTGFHLAGLESLCAIDIDKKALGASPFCIKAFVPSPPSPLPNLGEGRNGSN